MKIRQGFVSNSSSSSFVVAKAVVGEENFKKILRIIREAQEFDDETGYDYNENYICMNVSYHNEVFNSKFEELNLPTNSYLTMDY